MPQPRSIGDRIEGAIEDRADAEREIERGETEARPARSLARTVFWLAVTAVSLYGVAPSLIDVLGSWRDLSQLDRHDHRRIQWRGGRPGSTAAGRASRRDD